MIRGDDETVREKLEAYRPIVLVYEEYQLIYEQLYPRITPILSDMPKSPSEESQLEKIVYQRLSLSDKIKRIQNEMREKMNEILYMMECLDEREFLIVNYRYIRGMRWRDIEEKINYSESQCYRIHRNAIDKMEIEKQRQNMTVNDS